MPSHEGKNKGERERERERERVRIWGNYEMRLSEKRREDDLRYE